MIETQASSLGEITATDRQWLHLFYHSPIGIASADVSGHIKDSNPSFRKMLGYSLDEIQDLYIADITHPDDRLFFEEELKKLFKGRVSTFQVRKRCLKKDGGIVWTRNTLSAVKNSQDTLQGVIAIVEDVTEMHLAEEALRLREEQLNAAVSAANVGIWNFDFSTGKIKCSDRTKEILEIDSKQDIDFPSVFQKIPEEDQQQARIAFDKACDPKGDGCFEATLRFVMRSGSVRWLMSRGKILFEEKKGPCQPLHVAGVLLDLSEQMELQEDLKASKLAADAANETKSVFLANMSHEIRTPLGAIIGFADLLISRKEHCPELLEHLEIIRRNAHALMHIVDDILDLSKVEAGHLEIEMLNVPFYQLIEDVMAIFLEKARKKNIYLKYAIDEGVPKLISSDPTRVRQVLINLVDNAIKFTEKGGVDVHVHSEALEAGEQRIGIIVSDSGIGLTQDQLDKLFKPFAQAESSTTRRFGGTGLGLFLSKSLAQALQGDIKVLHCKLNEGCSFEFSFLTKAVNPETLDEQGLEGISEPRLDANLSGVKVLLAEDALDNQLLLSTVLKGRGATVKVADNGLEAVSLAMENGFDIILMDIQMPKMNGYEATKALRESGYRRPIVALTAHAMQKERQQVREAGFDCQLTKPVNLDELLKTVRRFSSTSVSVSR